MIGARLAIVAAGLLALATAACDSTLLGNRELDETQVLANTADLRMTFRDKANYNYDTHQVVPTRILCAEPSPDVAKVMESAFGASLGVAVPGTATGSGTVAVSTAEALAQLGERLATIQLLRDGLYRACEAYANGAISETEYVVLLSRYDDTMVTMLLGELAAGAFGRSLAGLGGSADSVTKSRASSLFEAADKLEQAAGKAQEDSEAKQKEAANARASADAAAEKAAESGEEEDRVAADEAEQTARLKERQAEEAGALESAVTSASAEAKTAANATAAGAIEHKPDQDAVKHIAEMQRKFIENINDDALVIACIHALSHAASAQTGMAALCGGENGLLARIVTMQGELLKSVKGRNIADRDMKAFSEAIEQVKQIITETETLKKAAAQE